MMTKNEKTVVVMVSLLTIAGIAGYLNNKAPEELVVTPTVGSAEILPDAPVIGDAEVVVIDEPFVVVGRTDKEPFRSGTELCQWYEDAGMRAVADANGWAESTCAGDTCFLLVHDAGLPAGFVMAAWISEARDNGHDPRKENVELSVFTFEGEEETDHVAYFPARDVFESY